MHYCRCSCTPPTCGSAGFVGQWGCLYVHRNKQELYLCICSLSGVTLLCLTLSLSHVHTGNPRYSSTTYDTGWNKPDVTSRPYLRVYKWWDGIRGAAPSRSVLDGDNRRDSSRGYDCCSELGRHVLVAWEQDEKGNLKTGIGPWGDIWLISIRCHRWLRSTWDYLCVHRARGRELDTTKWPHWASIYKGTTLACCGVHTDNPTGPQNQHSRK